MLRNAYRVVLAVLLRAVVLLTAAAAFAYAWGCLMREWGGLCR